MSLLLLAPDRNMKTWKDSLQRVDPNIEVEIWPAIENKEKVHFVVAWNQPKHLLNSFPNLKAVTSLGAGADHILDDESLPKDIPVCRVVSKSLVIQMKEYVLNAVLNYQRNTLTYLRQKQQGTWSVHSNKSKDEFSIGIMGLGKLGRPTASLLAGLEYRVTGWARTKKEIEGVITYAGQAALDPFLNETTLLVCMLPLTAETEGILDLDVFKKLKRPGYLVNVARGEHLVEEDLIYALDKNWLEGATLDVFSEEPLPDRHAFWNRENILITPHVSSLTPPGEVAEQIVENYKRALSGMELRNEVDKDKGY